MEVPDPRLSYNGVQCRGAVVSDTEGDTDAAMPEGTAIDRLAKSDIATVEIENEVRQRPIEVNIIRRSPVIARDETMCKEVTSSGNEIVASRQQYVPHRRSENSSRHSRQSDSEASGMAYHPW